MTRDVLILTECSPLFGMGHLARSLVLARALAARGAVVRFALTTPDCLGEARGFPASSAADAAPPADLLIVDGYRITAQTIAPFAASARATVLIDDTGDRPRPGDLVVNYQLYGERVDYAAYPARARLLGPRYFPLRPGLSGLRTDNDRRRARPLLTFGGGATAAFGFDVAHALARRFPRNIDLAIGAMAPAPASLPGNVTLHRGADFADLMRRATLYAGALGTSFVEALGAGLPCVGVVLAADQRQAAEAARALGIPVLDAPDAAGLAAIVADRLADPLPQALPDHPDGQGADRLADAVLAVDSE